MPGPSPRQHKHQRQYTPRTHSFVPTRRIWNDDYDGQMIFGDHGGLKFPDIRLTGEEKPRKNLTQEACPDRGSNLGPLRDKRACYHLLHSGGRFQRFNTGEETLKIYHVLEDLNYGIFRIYAEFGRKSSKSSRTLSEELDASKDNIHRQIKTLAKSYRSCRSVPHELTPQPSQRSVDICRQLIVLSWELSHVIKNGSVTATLAP